MQRHPQRGTAIVFAGDDEDAFIFQNPNVAWHDATYAVTVWRTATGAAVQAVKSTFGEVAAKESSVNSKLPATFIHEVGPALLHLSPAALRELLAEEGALDLALIDAEDCEWLIKQLHVVPHPLRSGADTLGRRQNAGSMRRMRAPRKRDGAVVAHPEHGEMVASAVLKVGNTAMKVSARRTGAGANATVVLFAAALRPASQSDKPGPPPVWPLVVTEQHKQLAELAALGSSAKPAGAKTPASKKKKTKRAEEEEPSEALTPEKGAATDEEAAVISVVSRALCVVVVQGQPHLVLRQQAAVKYGMACLYHTMKIGKRSYNIVVREMFGLITVQAYDVLANHFIKPLALSLTDMQRLRRLVDPTSTVDEGATATRGKEERVCM